MKNSEVHKTDLNMVYWSEEETSVSLSSANGSIDVFYIPKKDLDNPKGKELREKFFKENVFYFSEVQLLCVGEILSPAWSIINAEHEISMYQIFCNTCSRFLHCLLVASCTVGFSFLF